MSHPHSDNLDQMLAITAADTAHSRQSCEELLRACGGDLEVSCLLPVFPSHRDFSGTKLVVKLMS